MRARRVLKWTGFNLALWLAVTAVFGWWIRRQVQAEYRAGLRTSAEGDAIAIPIYWFAVALAVILLAANLGLGLVRLLRRRRSRLVTQHRR
jgi:hypothetical protein